LPSVETTSILKQEKGFILLEYNVALTDCKNSFVFNNKGVRDGAVG
jgi:hypothetical protein